MSAFQRSDEVELAEAMAALAHDPLGHVLYVYPWGVKGTELAGEDGPRQWQRDVMNSIKDKLDADARDLGQVIQEATASGHGIGKSALVSWLIKWALDTHEDTRGIVTANTDTQLRTKTWPEVGKWHRLAINSHWFTHTATALSSNHEGHEKTWRVDAIPWSENNTEAFAGLHNAGKRVLLVFDEASAIADKVWEVAEGALTDENTEIIWAAFGNPTRNIGRFRECFRKFSHRWTGRQIDSRMVDGTNKLQIQNWVDDYGVDSDFVKVRVRGMFPSMSAKQYFNEVDVDAAYGRHLRDEQYKFAPVIITCDPAWEGDDELVISKRQGLMFKVLKVMPKNDNDVWVANELARIEDEECADAVIIDGGYGTGIISAGRTMGRDWLICWFSEASSDQGCLNKRAEIHQSTKRWLKEGGSIAEDAALRDEILSIEAKARLDGKLQIQSKQEIKDVLGRSPNRLDSLCLSFAYPVVERKPRDPSGDLLWLRDRGQGRSVTEYDPFAPR